MQIKWKRANPVIGPHRMHCIDAAHCYTCRTFRGLCVVLVCAEHSKHGWTDRDAVWNVDSRGGTKNHVLDEWIQIHAKRSTLAESCVRYPWDNRLVQSLRPQNATRTETTQQERRPTAMLPVTTITLATCYY